MEQSLVSLITACYDSVKWIGRLIDSVCSQTYRPLELIVVDDGSRDGLAEVFQTYIGQLENSRVSWKYIRQENSGISAAVNAGLSVYTGEFLCFIDPDDFLTPDSLEKRVDFLRKHPQYPMVTCDAFRVTDEVPPKILGLVSMNDKRRFEERQFELLMKEQSIFCPLCHLIRADAFRETHPSGRIYPSRYGQNWQILLPVLYRYPRGFLDEPLGYYLVRQGSLSRRHGTEEENIEKQKAHQDIQMHVLGEMEMPEDERKKYMRECRIHFARKLLAVGRRYGNRDLLREQRAILKELRVWSGKDLCQYAAGVSRLIGVLYRAGTGPVKYLINKKRSRL